MNMEYMFFEFMFPAKFRWTHFTIILFALMDMQNMSLHATFSFEFHFTLTAFIQVIRHKQWVRFNMHFLVDRIVLYFSICVLNKM